MVFAEDSLPMAVDMALAGLFVVPHIVDVGASGQAGDLALWLVAWIQLRAGKDGISPDAETTSDRPARRTNASTALRNVSSSIVP